MPNLFGRFATAAVVAIGIMTPLAVQSQEKSTWEQIQSTKTLRMGCAQSEPWCFKDITGKADAGGVESNGSVYRGVAVSLGQEVAKTLGVKLEVVETTWGAAVAGLQANQFDLMFQLDATPERALSIDFAGPVMWYPVAFLVNEDFKPTTWEEMSDPKYKLAAPMGSNFVNEINRNSPNSTLVTFQQSNDAIAAFQAGRIDGAAMTGPMVDISRLRLRTGKTLVPKPVIVRPSGAGIRSEADKRWRDFLQVAVTYAYDSGETQRFYEAFLKERGMDIKTAVSIRKEDLLR